MLIKNFSLSLDIRSRPGLVLNNMHQFYDLCSKFLRSSNSKSRVAHALVSLKNCSYLTSFFFSLGTASLDPGGQIITRKWELSPEVRPTRFDEIRRGPKCRSFHEFSYSFAQRNSSFTSFNDCYDSKEFRACCYCCYGCCLVRRRAAAALLVCTGRCSAPPMHSSSNKQKLAENKFTQSDFTSFYRQVSPN